MSIPSRVVESGPLSLFVSGFREDLGRLVGRWLKPGTVRNHCNHTRAFLADRERLTGDLARTRLAAHPSAAWQRSACSGQ